MEKLGCCILGILLLVSPFSLFALENDTAPIPDFLLQKAAAYVVNHMGKELFRDSVRHSGDKVLDEEGTLYAVFFEYVPNESPRDTIQIAIRSSITENCSAWEDRPPPFCRSDFNHCRVEVDRDEAVYLAKENGLEDGIKPWEVELRTMRWFEPVLWTVTNFIPKKKDGIVSRTMIFNAYSGEYLDELVTMEIH